MKPRNPVILSRHCDRRRQDILSVDALYTVTYQGEPISIAMVAEDPDLAATPRYQNNLYSQLKSAQNAARRLNTAFDTDDFAACEIKFAV